MSLTQPTFAGQLELQTHRDICVALPRVAFPPPLGRRELDSHPAAPGLFQKTNTRQLEREVRIDTPTGDDITIEVVAPTMAGADNAAVAPIPETNVRRQL